MNTSDRKEFREELKRKSKNELVRMVEQMQSVLDGGINKTSPVVVRGLPKHLEQMRQEPQIANFTLDRQGRALYAETNRGTLVSVEFINEINNIIQQINDMVRMAHVAAQLEGARKIQAFKSLSGQPGKLYNEMDDTVYRYASPDNAEARRFMQMWEEYLNPYREAIKGATAGDYALIEQLSTDPAMDRRATVNADILKIATRGRAMDMADDWLVDRCNTIRNRFEKENPGKLQEWVDTFYELQRLLEYENSSKEWVTEIREALARALSDPYDAHERNKLVDRIRKARNRRKR